MRRLLIPLALIAGSLYAGTSNASNPHPEVNCVGTVVWVTYGQPVGCNVNPPQVLHERYLPSNWTLAQAHTYCANVGGDAVHTRYAGVANVCTNVDY